MSYREQAQARARARKEGVVMVYIFMAIMGIVCGLFYAAVNGHIRHSEPVPETRPCEVEIVQVSQMVGDEVQLVEMEMCK